MLFRAKLSGLHQVGLLYLEGVGKLHLNNLQELFYNNAARIVINFVSSPGLKAQVSFSNRLLSVCKLFTFSSSPEPLAQFQQSLVQSILRPVRVKGNQVCSDEGPHPFTRGDYSENTLRKFKNLLL